MSDPFDAGADVYFDGDAGDWREDAALIDEDDPDDELLAETPPDVIAVLGFDPAEDDA